MKMLKNLVKKLLTYLNFNIPSFLNFHKLIIPVQGGVGFQNLLRSERWMVTLLDIIINKYSIGTLVDVGVNIGQTYIKYKKINSNANYVGFEPNPSCYLYTKKLLQVNNDFNSKLVPVGLGESSGLISFYASSVAASDGTMISGLRVANSTISKQIIPIFCFDNIYHDLNISGNIVLKIDVEGGELDVLSGMKDFIPNFLPIIICEVLHADSEGKMAFNHERNARLKKLVDSFGYHTYQIIKNNTSGDFLKINKVDFFNEGVWNLKYSPLVCDYIFAHSSISLQEINLTN